MSDQPKPASRVTLEDLLRIKRAERPPAEFWMDFERSLRAKQLAAIVDKRPWWRTLPNFSRWSIPLGAAAALTLTITTLSHSRSRAPAAIAKVGGSPVTTETAAPAPVLLAPMEASAAPAPSHIAVATFVSPKPASLTSVAEAQTPRAETHTEAGVPALSIRPVATSVQLASVSEQVAGLGSSGENEQASPARFTAVAHRDSAAVRDLNAFFEKAVARLDPGLSAVKSTSIEPLAQIQTPREIRRARLLAFAGGVDTHAPQYTDNMNVIRSRERIASHLNEEALYDSIRRLGLKNGGVSIQF